MPNSFELLAITRAAWTDHVRKNPVSSGKASSTLGTLQYQTSRGWPAPQCSPGCPSRTSLVQPGLTRYAWLATAMQTVHTSVRSMVAMQTVHTLVLRMASVLSMKRMAGTAVALWLLLDSALSQQQ